MDFVSLPVVSGFTSAAAITIASSQLKGLLGLKFSSENFIDTWAGVFRHIGETRLTDTLMSLGCCVVLMGMKVRGILADCCRYCNNIRLLAVFAGLNPPSTIVSPYPFWETGASLCVFVFFGGRGLRTEVLFLTTDADIYQLH